MVQAAEHYLLLFLNSPAGTATMKNLAVTTSGLYNLSVAKIRSIVDPLPPSVEHARIRQRVDDLMRYCDELEERLTRQVSTQGLVAESSTASFAA